MSASGPQRAGRLLTLMEILYQHRYPISGHQLAAELSVSLRTLYRDIAALRMQGADIQGEAGTGFILSRGYLLPPLMYTPEQLDALALGLRWVQMYGDAGIAKAASEVKGKVSQGLPDELQTLFGNSTLLVGKAAPSSKVLPAPLLIRRAIRQRLKVRAVYTDRSGHVSERVIWPFAIGYFSGEIILAAWCELRNDFRHFDVSRLDGLDLLQNCYPHPRNKLISMWRQAGRDIHVKPFP